jgi:hypothetical protein
MTGKKTARAHREQPPGDATKTGQAAPDLPAAVYLDTNPIDTLPVSLAHGGFVAFKDLCARLQVPLRIPELCVAEFIQHKRTALPADCNRVQKHFNYFMKP